jgi:2-oxoglutarate ferredoxin oxidoreductase subunit gamma
MKRFEIRYGAVGGQGIITAGALLVDIAVKIEDKFALESPTYTATVRGGPTKVDVVVSDEPVVFPHATAIDLFVCTDQKPYDLYRNRIKDDAIVVVDTNLVKEIGDTRNWTVYKIPLINETKKRVGNIVLTSVVTLALTQKLTGVIQYDHMLEFIKEWAPADFLEMNLKAIEVGQSLV